MPREGEAGWGQKLRWSSMDLKERSRWEKEYLDSGKQCLKGLKKQLDPRRSSWERERESNWV